MPLLYVQITKVDLRLRVTLFGRTTHPFECFPVVLDYALASEIQKCVW